MDPSRPGQWSADIYIRRRNEKNIKYEIDINNESRQDGRTCHGGGGGGSSISARGSKRFLILSPSATVCVSARARTQSPPSHFLRFHQFYSSLAPAAAPYFHVLRRATTPAAAAACRDRQTRPSSRVGRAFFFPSFFRFFFWCFYIARHKCTQKKTPSKNRIFTA